MLPKEYRDIAEKNWDRADVFNYSSVLRQALHDYYKKNRWVK